MRRYCLILLLFIVPASFHAQMSVLDSLKNSLRSVSADSSKLNTLSDIIYEYSEINWDSATFYADMALPICRSNKWLLSEAFILNIKGYVLMKKRMYPESYVCFQSAFVIAEDPSNQNKINPGLVDIMSSDPRLSILANIHHDFGHLMGTTGNIDKQVYHYTKTRELSEILKDVEMLGFVNMNLGRVYADMNRLDTALVMEKEAERIFLEANQIKYLGNVYRVMGNIYMEKNDETSALKHFHLGIKSAKASGNHSILGHIYSALTRYYLETKLDVDSGLHYSSMNLKVLQDMQSTDLGLVYTNLFQCYKLKHESDSAMKYIELAMITKDSISAQRMKSLNVVQNLSFDEKYRIQELEKENIQNQGKIRTYSLLGGLIFFLGYGLLLIRNNRKKNKANRALEAALENLKTTQTQLVHSEKMASLGELTAGIAHEIQNPLNFVNNFSDVSNELLDEMALEIEQGNYSEAKEILADVKQNLEKVSHHGRRADSIVKGMLQHSRTSNGQKEATDINALCDEYLRLSYHGIRAKDKMFNAGIKTDFDASMEKINLNTQDVGRVILNLLTNAFYAVNKRKQQAQSDYEPLVSVVTKNNKSNIEISVRDNGGGIPHHILDKIFQPFFTTKPAGEGTGLGLSLSYDIITKGHGGELIVNTIEGESTEFLIKIPK
jgi:two-component system NtrC family sensor kinase